MNHGTRNQLAASRRILHSVAVLSDNVARIRNEFFRAILAMIYEVREEDRFPKLIESTPVSYKSKENTRQGIEGDVACHAESQTSGA
jgi:hypothetical protein